VFHGYLDSIKGKGICSTPVQKLSSGKTLVTQLIEFALENKKHMEFTILLVSIGRPMVAEEVNTYLPQGTLPTPSFS
jgi:hypothetical protein